MNKGSKLTTKYPELKKEVIRLLGLHRIAFDQERVFEKVVSLFQAEIFSFGRKTVTGLLMTLGEVEEDWSRWYRLFTTDQFNEERVNRELFAECVGETVETEAVVIGVDGFHVPRTSKKMPGTNWAKPLNTAHFRPGLERAQRFLNCSWFTPIENGFSRAIPIRCLSIFPEKAVHSAESPRMEWEGAASCFKWIRERLSDLGRAHQPVLVLADGTYDHLELWPSLPENFWLVARTARNRILYHLPPPRTGKPGRPAEYGNQAPYPKEYLRQRKGFKKVAVTIRGHRRHVRARLEGPFLRERLPQIPVFLIVVGGGKRPTGSRRKQYKPAHFLVSAVEDAEGNWTVPVPFSQLLEWLWQRWELEVAHRNMKTSFGLGEKQCWNERSAISSVQWSAWVYAVLTLAGYKAWPLNGGPKPLGRWRSPSKRWSIHTLLRGFRVAFWPIEQLNPSCTRSRDNWPEKGYFSSLFVNAAVAASRG